MKRCSLVLKSNPLSVRIILRHREILTQLGFLQLAASSVVPARIFDKTLRNSEILLFPTRSEQTLAARLRVDQHPKVGKMHWKYL
jgi:hypothetical protein